MKALKAILLGAVAVLLAAACRSGDDASSRMHRLEQKLLASQQVDSCLVELRDINAASLARPSDRARWSLLHAMALDKNYIDTTDLSVIQPAIDYYTKWYCPSRSKKFYTWYYKARIEENAWRYDASLDSYLHAEQYMCATNDTYRTRLYFGFERVYEISLDRKKAYDSAKKALCFSLLSGDSYNYSVALLDCAFYAIDLGNTDEAESLLQSFESRNEDIQNSVHYGRYCWTRMMFYLRGKPSCVDSLKKYTDLAAHNASVNEMLLCSHSYCIMGDYSNAEEVISQFESIQPVDKSKRQLYYRIKSDISFAKMDYKHAYEYLKLCHSEQEQMYMANVDNEISSLAERTHGQIRKMKFIILGLIKLIVVLVILFVFADRLRKSRYESLMLGQSLENIKKEHEAFLSFFSGEAQVYDEDIWKVKERLIEIVKNVKHSRTGLGESVKALCDFAGSSQGAKWVALLCNIYSRRFYEKLRAKELSDFEIGYSTLLTLRLRVKEVEWALGRKDLYNVNSRIRMKFNIPSESKDLPIFLQELYVETLNENALGLS